MVLFDLGRMFSDNLVFNVRDGTLGKYIGAVIQTEHVFFMADLFTSSGNFMRR